MYVYVLPLTRVTVNIAVLPFLMTFVFLPAILKSCGDGPLFTSLKTTLPCGAVFRESVNLKSFAVTFTVVTVELAPANGTTTNSVAAATAAATSMETVRFMDLLRLWTPSPRQYL